MKAAATRQGAGHGALPGAYAPPPSPRTCHCGALLSQPRPDVFVYRCERGHVLEPRLLDAPPYHLVHHGGRFVVIPEGGIVPSGWAFPARYARAFRREQLHGWSIRNTLPPLSARQARPRRMAVYSRGRWSGVIWRPGRLTRGGRPLRNRRHAERWLRHG